MEKTLRGRKSFFHHPVPVTYSNPWSHESRKNFPGSEKFFSAILSPSHIRTPGPTKAKKTFPGSEKFFSAILSPSHIRTPGPTKAEKTFRGKKSFFCDPVPVTYPNPWSHKGRPNFSAAPKVFGQTPTSQPDLPTLIISYFNLNSPEVSFRIPKLKLRPPKYYNFTRPNQYFNGMPCQRVLLNPAPLASPRPYQTWSCRACLGFCRWGCRWLPCW